MSAPVPPPAAEVPLPAWLRPPLAALYGGAVRLRAAAYRHGWRRVTRLPVPVVSVGNLTAGGAGKTPFVEFLARTAIAAGRRPAVISRGYRARSRSAVMRLCAAEGSPLAPEWVGDEPALLARRNPALPVYVGRSRAEAARLALAVDAPDLLILDDAFQHLRVARDRDVVLLDAARGLGGGHVLPWGWLREPVGALRRADALVISKAGQGDADVLERRLREIVGPAPPILRCDFAPERLVRLDGARDLPPEALAGTRVGLLCAIAQPESFAATVRALGAEVGERLSFRDHFDYDAAALEALAERLAGADPERPQWITTGKDAVKLQHRLAHPERLWVLEMAVAPLGGAERFFFDLLAHIGLE